LISLPLHPSPQCFHEDHTSDMFVEVEFPSDNTHDDQYPIPYHSSLDRGAWSRTRPPPPPLCSRPPAHETMPHPPLSSLLCVHDANQPRSDSSFTLRCNWICCNKPPSPSHCVLSVLSPSNWVVALLIFSVFGPWCLRPGPPPPPPFPLSLSLSPSLPLSTP